MVRCQALGPKLQRRHAITARARDSLVTARALTAAVDMEFKGAQLALSALASSP
jgi:hypothetical protein